MALINNFIQQEEKCIILNKSYYMSTMMMLRMNCINFSNSITKLIFSKPLIVSFLFLIMCCKYIPSNSKRKKSRERSYKELWIFPIVQRDNALIIGISKNRSINVGIVKIFFIIGYSQNPFYYRVFSSIVHINI